MGQYPLFYPYISNQYNRISTFTMAAVITTQASLSTVQRNFAKQLSPRPTFVRSVKARTLKVASRKAVVTSAASVGVFFSTTTGNTEEVAGLVQEAFGDAADAPTEIGDLGEDLEGLMAFDNLVLGCPTWNTGADEGRSGTAWDDVLETLGGMDFSGKKVAVFGCGDSGSYSDYFCDALDEVYTTFSGAGAEMVGHFSTEGYEFDESKSCVGGPASSDDASEMVGLAIDIENQSDLTDERVEQWVGQLKGQMGM